MALCLSKLDAVPPHLPGSTAPHEPERVAQLLHAFPGAEVVAPLLELGFYSSIPEELGLRLERAGPIVAGPLLFLFLSNAGSLGSGFGEALLRRLTLLRRQRRECACGSFGCCLAHGTGHRNLSTVRPLGQDTAISRRILALLLSTLLGRYGAAQPPQGGQG